MHLVSETRPQVKRDRLMSLSEVESTTSVKKSTIYSLMRAGKFPQCVALSPRRVAWPESAVLQWVQDRITEARVSVQTTGVAQ